MAPGARAQRNGLPSPGEAHRRSAAERRARSQYRRRSEPQWYEWGNLAAWVWDEEDDGDDADDGDGDDDPDPEPELEEVRVWLTGLSTELDDGTTLTFNEDVGEVDLLLLDGLKLELANVEIPTGTYKHVAFRLDPARSFVVEGGEEKPLSIPEPDVRLEGPFDVNPSELTSVTLHFDTDASLTRGKDGSWSLDPVVSLEITGG